MSKTALITGATSGFGKACAEKFASEGWSLIITGRREERLNELKNKLEQEHGVGVITSCFDVRIRSEVESAFERIATQNDRIDLLVNNAGLASGLDKIQEGDIDDWDKMIDTNVKGLLYVTKNAIPMLKKSESAQIINIGSTAGKEVYEMGNVYCASKHAVDALSKGMRIDLLQYGIKVTQIAPGAAETEFSIVRFHGDEQRANSVYNGYQPMTAEDIAHLAHFSTTLPPHLCINDLVVTSLAQANSFYIHRINQA